MYPVASLGCSPSSDTLECQGLVGMGQLGVHPCLILHPVLAGASPTTRQLNHCQDRSMGSG